MDHHAWAPGGWLDGETWQACGRCPLPARCRLIGRCEQEILVLAVPRCTTCVDPAACAVDGCAAARHILRSAKP